MVKKLGYIFGMFHNIPYGTYMEVGTVTVNGLKESWDYFNGYLYIVIFSNLIRLVTYM